MSIPRGAGFWSRLCSCTATVFVCLGLFGCASQKSGPQHASGIGMSAKSATSVVTPHPDDPREPWSPNYGPQERIEDSAPARSLPPIEAGSTRIANIDADAIIRHAVAQHEMRRP